METSMFINLKLKRLSMAALAICYSSVTEAHANLFVNLICAALGRSELFLKG